jgi:hypothetical protein
MKILSIGNLGFGWDGSILPETIRSDILGLMKKLKLSNCADYALVDTEDYEGLLPYAWRKNAQGYAVRRVYTRISKGVRHAKDIRMHRQIMGEPEGMEVDHVDNNGLNNQKNNLRVATHWQNLANRALQKNNTSGYRGVSWSKQAGKWWAQLYIDSKTVHLGLFDDIEDAAKAYNEAAIERYGEFARLNEL